jgi:hypothetical protein
MKIEIGESLISSYLRHVEDCRIVQTNWKTSNQWKITEYEEKKSRELFEKINSSPFFKGVFKNNEYEQLIKQAEIDVLGINTTEKSVFGIDVAFHTAGLNYGSVDETRFRILKKIFRTIFVLQTYFSEFDKFNSYFVTPKANPSTEKPIRELIEEANKLIDDEMISVNFICNESFFNSIVDATINNIDDDNDTSELFLRSIKLIQLDKRVSSSADYEKVHKNSAIVTDKTFIDGMKIGQYIQYNMRKLYEQNLVTKEEINNLQSKEYSKNVFDQNYEVLRSADKEITGKDGRPRYYANEKFFGDYYLCSQWVERHWKPFLDWLEKMNKKNE